MAIVRYQTENNFGFIDPKAIVAINAYKSVETWIVEIWLKQGDFIRLDGIQEMRNAMSLVEYLEKEVEKCQET